MKNKGALVLIEQAVMLLVFALAAVLCLRAFVWADTTSKEITARDGALIQAQNAAETLKSCAGDLDAAADQMGGIRDGAGWVVLYDESWNVTDEEHTYMLRAMPDRSGLAYLGRAEVSVYRGDSELTALEVCWQEVTDVE